MDDSSSTELASQRIAPSSASPQDEAQVVPAPHWLPQVLESLAQFEEPDAQAPETRDVPLAMGTEVHLAGINSALQRLPKLEAELVPLLKSIPLGPAWKPNRPRIQTFGLKFPEGIEFLPPAKPKEEAPATTKEDSSAPEAVAGESATDVVSHEVTAADLIAKSEAALEEKPAPKLTRIKPPAGVLTLEDRLFYLLQPPLQTWLKGQELIMPFEPFPYQYEGIAWLFSHDAALLADEMGLGKTMQTITAIRLLVRSGQVRRVVLVCPKPLLPNWQREFRTWAEELPFVVVEGDTDRRRITWTMPGVPVLIVNYETLVRDVANFGDDFPKFDLVVLDEAQRIKNRTSRTAETARAIPRRRSWALTGTPIENRPEELGALYEFLEVVPPNSSPDLKQLQSLSKEFILRRTKDLVMKDMPPRLDRDAILELSAAQRYTYETAEKEGVIQLNEMGDSISIQHVFELVMRLKQITNWDPLTGESAKFDRLEADMEEVAASGGKAILFSQWTKTIDFLKGKLERFGPLVYHGGIPTKLREPVLKQFKEDPTKHIILMSYATGAVGLNLQFAGYVFLYDRWWNPAIEDQAINRAHRIGCKSQVIVTRFISKDTIEEKIDRVLTEKRDLFKSILGDGDDIDAARSLTASEIFGLFDLKARHGKGTRPIQPKPQV